MRLKALRLADSGTFVNDGQWLLKNVKSTEISPQGARISRADEWVWKTVLKPSILTVYQVAPEKLEMTSLYDNISVLGSNQQKPSRFEIALWNKIFTSSRTDDGTGAALRVLSSDAQAALASVFVGTIWASFSSRWDGYFRTLEDHRMAAPVFQRFQWSHLHSWLPPCLVAGRSNA
jgi:hypothetical protein